MTSTKLFVIEILKKFGDNAHSAILALRVFELKIVKLRRFFRRFRQIQRYWAGDIGPL